MKKWLLNSINVIKCHSGEEQNRMDEITNLTVSLTKAMWSNGWLDKTRKKNYIYEDYKEKLKI